MNRRSMAAFRQMRALVVVAGLGALAGAAAAQEPGWRFWTGRDLLKSCHSSLSGRVGCTGYIAGVVASHETFAASGYGRRLFCPPAGTKVGELRKRVIDFLEVHPEAHGRAAAGLTLAAMQAAYPCGNGKPKRR